MNISEYSTASNFQSVTTTHLSFDLKVDFNTKKVSGNVEYTLLRKDDLVEELVLDTKNLEIINCMIKEKDRFTSTNYQLETTHPFFGSPLKIRLTPRTSHVKIDFKTTERSNALQFLAPEQTAGKIHPYLFTQCQAINARSFFPCQDTPAVKATYFARVTVPYPLVALMSAIFVSSETGETNTYYFEQLVPISSYLTSLAVGELESREISHRSKVWGEPSVIDRAHYEFLETEKYLSTAEQIAGEYVWGRYDLLVLPPSFPYGGMENACMVYLTPSLLAGDRSLVNVVAHEIAHCWFGNLVTNSTWVI